MKTNRKLGAIMIGAIVLLSMGMSFSLITPVAAYETTTKTVTLFIDRSKIGWFVIGTRYYKLTVTVYYDPWAGDWNIVQIKTKLYTTKSGISPPGLHYCMCSYSLYFQGIYIEPGTLYIYPDYYFPGFPGVSEDENTHNAQDHESMHIDYTGINWNNVHTLGWVRWENGQWSTGSGHYY